VGHEVVPGKGGTVPPPVWVRRPSPGRPFLPQSWLAFLMQLLLWLTSFLAGAVVMVIELAGARLLGPVFGSSVIPWTSVIAVILAGVAAGNAWGGRIAAVGAMRALERLLLLASALLLLPLLRGELPEMLMDRLGVIGGSLTASGFLLAPPAFLLGAVGPLLVAVATTELSEVGRRSGALNGANALGAIVGTLATGFLLIPLLPLSRIFLLTASLLLLMAGGLRLALRFHILPTPSAPENL